MYFIIVIEYFLYNTISQDSYHDKFIVCFPSTSFIGSTPPRFATPPTSPLYYEQRLLFIIIINILPDSKTAYNSIVHNIEFQTQITRAQTGCSAGISFFTTIYI